MAERTYPVGEIVETISYQYDANDNPISITEALSDSSIAVTRQSWDDFDRLQSVTDRYGQTLSYGYDANGNRSRLIDPAEGTTLYTFDEPNRLATEVQSGQGVTTYGWKKNSLLESIAYPKDVVLIHIYDLANRVESITNERATTAISSFSYSYDKNGNRRTQEEAQGGTLETTTYAYDRANRLETVSYPDQTVIYTYDSVGNRLTELALDPGSIPLVNQLYTYNDRHQLTGVTDLLDPSGSAGYTYDDNGNQTSRTIAGSVLTFLYDARDQLEEVQQGGNLLERYANSFLGLRVRKSGPAGVERITYDDQSAYWRTDDFGNRTATYHWVPDRLLSLDSATEGLSFYLQDALGSPTNHLGLDGTLRARQQFDVWGNLRGITNFGTTNSPFTFTGCESDESTGLLYAKARHYDPVAGRFLTEDPFEGIADTPPSLHKYLYGYANPTVFVDPTGRMTEAVQDAVLLKSEQEEGLRTSTAVGKRGERAFDNVINAGQGAGGEGLPESLRFRGVRQDPVTGELFVIGGETKSEPVQSPEKESSSWQKIVDWVKEPVDNLKAAFERFEDTFKENSGSLTADPTDEEAFEGVQSEGTGIGELAEEGKEVVVASAKVAERGLEVQGAAAGGVVLVQVVKGGMRRLVEKKVLRKYLEDSWGLGDDVVEIGTGRFGRLVDVIVDDPATQA